MCLSSQGTHHHTLLGTKQDVQGEVNSILTLRTWRQHQVSQVKAQSYKTAFYPCSQKPGLSVT